MTTDAIQRHHVVQRGQAHPPMVFAHGFGCDQQMWRFVAPAFEASHRVVLFDHIGCGKSDLSAYDAQRHSRLEGYAETWSPCSTRWTCVTWSSSAIRSAP